MSQHYRPNVLQITHIHKPLFHEILVMYSSSYTGFRGHTKWNCSLCIV